MVEADITSMFDYLDELITDGGELSIYEAKDRLVDWFGITRDRAEEVTKVYIEECEEYPFAKIERK